MKKFLGAILFLTMCVPCYGEFVDSPTTEWNVFSFPSGNQADYFDDTQAGLPEGDLVGSNLVGTNVNPVAYYSFSDDYLAFRVRVGASLPQSGTFEHNLFFGMDANCDGNIDLYLGVDNIGSDNQLSLWSAGNDSNVGPSSTSISGPIASFVQDDSSYSFAAVTAINDPSATSFDIDSDGNNDYFVSFRIAKSDILTNTIGDFSHVRFVIATATQDNALNQDIAGVDGLGTSGATYEELGAFTACVPTGVPEPGSIFLLMLAGSGITGYWTVKKFRKK